MKKLLTTAAASLACLAAFAQGRVQFLTDSLHLVYYNPGLPNYGGVNLGGQPVWGSNMPPGVTLVADFYLGSGSSSLSLITSTTFSGTAPGKWSIYNYQAPGIPGGSTVYMLTQIRDTGTIPESTWTPFSTPLNSFWYGRSEEFSFVLGTSTVAYPPMVTTGALLGGGFSTWQTGDYEMGVITSALTGSRGAIVVGIPEPASVVLACLGAATMLIFWRCK